MKQAIIILGAGVMQGPAINIAKELGLYAIALDGSTSAPCISMADRFEQIDLKDKEGIEAFARSIQGSYDRIGIMTAGTDFSASVAWVAEKLGLPGIPYEAALNASDKGRMRECFRKSGLPSPPFYILTSNDLSRSSPRRAVLDKPSTHNSSQTDFTCAGTFCIDSSTPLNEVHLRFPVVIKPVDNMGSRGCRRVDSAEEFPEAAKSAIGFSRSGRAIVESYMDGPEFSVDAIVYKGEITICGLADRHIFFPPYFIEMGHTMPTVIDLEKQKAMLDTFCQGINALGIIGKDYIGAAKGDIKLTANGAMIGEIAARLSGGYMSGWTYPYSSGALPIKAAIQTAMGYEPDCLTQTKKWTCAERAFISIPGTVKQIVGMQEAQKTEHVNNFFLRIKEGDKVAFPENNVTKCGNIIASASDRETAIRSAETAARSVLIRLDPADMETGKFLEEFTTNSFPPDAFQLTDELKSALAKIPEFTTNQHEPVPVVLTRTRESDMTKSSCGLWLKNEINLIPFPELETSNLRDYMGRTVQEALDAVRFLTGFPLPKAAENAENITRLDRSFWIALIRGSYQGAVYYIDKLEEAWAKSKVYSYCS